MTSKKSKNEQIETTSLQDDQSTQTKSAAEASKGKSQSKTSAVPQKRKADKDEKPSKSVRRSARGAEKDPVDPVKVINFLLSSEAGDLCRPKDEAAQLAEKGGNYRTYSSQKFSPFEELVCACVLSRPIGHTLGLRSIRTLLNEPYNFNTPKAITEAGFDVVRGALDNARTQHRQKTAEQLITLAKVVAERFSSGEDDVSMEKVRQDCSKDVDQERETMKSAIKGLGPTGLDIFGRRIQGQWEEWYPFMDQRTSAALEQFDLPGDPMELDKFLDQRWKEIDSKDTTGGGDHNEQKKKLFVMLLERAVGADLEGNLEAVLEKIRE